jgi:hypothetical protein
MLLRLPLALFLFAAFATAQAYVVDAANGPGAHFPDLWSAVAAVPDGAVLTVRPGLYVGPTIQGKGLTVLGEPGARLMPIVNVALRIENLTPTQNVVVRGFELEPIRNLGAIDVVCLNNLGGVVLDGLVPNPGVYSTRRLLAAQNDRLLVRGCHFNATSELTGCHAVLLQSAFSASALAAPGLRTTGGSVQIVGGAVGGGFGFGQPGGAGVSMNGGGLRLLGNLQLAGGLGVGSTSGLSVDGMGTVRIDPAVVLQGPAPWFGPGLQVTTAPQALASVDDPSLGAPVTARLHGPLGQLGVLAVGFAGPSQTVPGLADRLFWNPPSAVTQVVGVPAAGAPLQGAVLVPNQPTFVGLQFVWHGLSYDPATGLQASNPVVHVVH